MNRTFTPDTVDTDTVDTDTVDTDTVDTDTVDTDTDTVDTDTVDTDTDTVDTPAPTPAEKRKAASLLFGSTLRTAGADPDPAVLALLVDSFKAAGRKHLDAVVAELNAELDAQADSDEIDAKEYMTKSRAVTKLRNAIGAALDANKQRPVRTVDPAAARAALVEKARRAASIRTMIEAMHLQAADAADDAREAIDGITPDELALIGTPVDPVQAVANHAGAILRWANGTGDGRSTGVPFDVGQTRWHVSGASLRMVDEKRYVLTLADGTDGGTFTSPSAAGKAAGGSVTNGLTYFGRTEAPSTPSA
jgi:hypothetical protein